MDLLGIDNYECGPKAGWPTFRTMDLLGIDNFIGLFIIFTFTFRTVDLLGIDNLSWHITIKLFVLWIC